LRHLGKLLRSKSSQITTLSNLVGLPLSKCKTVIKHWLQLQGSTAKSLPVRFSRSMKQSPEKLGRVKAVSALGAAMAQVVDHQAWGASATKIELAVATITQMEVAAYTTAKVEPGTEVEAAGALAQAADQVGAGVPPANIYVND
jgi:hypothetical protein